MLQCSVTSSEASKNWPEGTVVVKLTMNPYVFAMAMEECFQHGMKPWEFINVAIWEKLGKPDQDTLMKFAANLEACDEDPKWKKRLIITARHELAMARAREEPATRESQEPSHGNGQPS